MRVNPFAVEPMLSDDTYRSRLAVAIAELRYWVPSISDAAEIEETETSAFWRLAVTPKLPQACPFELILRADQLHDILIAGESYENRPIGSLDIFLPLAQAITDGAVVQRRWFSSATGRPLSIETLVSLPGGATWREGERPPREQELAVEFRDRHFLAYRR